MNFDLRGQAGAAAYRLLTNLVVPRPIAWVTSKDERGVVNLAPFSFFNLVGAEPPIVAIGVGNERDGRPKHTARNIAATKEFVVNLVTEELMQAMNISAADFPEGESELHAARLHDAASSAVGVPRVAEAKAALECVLHRIDRIGANNIILGEVVAIHTADGLVDDRMRVQDFHPVARLGGASWYSRITDRFEVPRISYAQYRQNSVDRQT